MIGAAREWLAPRWGKLSQPDLVDEAILKRLRRVGGPCRRGRQKGRNADRPFRRPSGIGWNERACPAMPPLDRVNADNRRLGLTYLR